MARTKSLNRVTAETVSTAFGGRVSVRTNVAHKGQLWVDDRGASLQEWVYSSTVCPSVWMKKRHASALAAIERAESLWDSGARFCRVVLAPRDAAPDDASLDEVEARALDFNEALAVWSRRINHELEPLGVSVVLRASHAALAVGRLVPNTHLLLACDGSVSAAQARELLGLLLRRDCISAVVSAPPTRVRGFIRSRPELIAHLSYLFGYPLAFYRDAALREKVVSPSEFSSLIEGNAALFFSGLSSLASADFTLKGSVVSLGLLRKKPASSPRSKKHSGPIRVQPPAPLEARSVESLGLVKASAPAAPVEAVRPVAPLKVPPAKHDLPQCEPRILTRIETECEEVPGLRRVTLLVSGCREKTVMEIAEIFPEAGELWVMTRRAIFFASRGLDFPKAIELGRIAGRAWRAALEERRRERILAAKKEQERRQVEARLAAKAAVANAVRPASTVRGDVFKVAREYRFKPRHSLGVAAAKYLGKPLRFSAEGRHVVGVVEGVVVVRCEVDSLIEARVLSAMGNRVIESGEAVEKARECQVAEMCAA